MKSTVLKRDEPPISVRHAQRQEGEARHEQRQPGPPGNAAQALLERTERSGQADAPLVVTRHPFVASDLGARRALGGRRLLRAFERPGEALVVEAAHLIPS